MDNSNGQLNYSNRKDIHKMNSLLMLESLINNKSKFKLDNHFDKNNCRIFLSEKEKYLSEIIIDDEEEPIDMNFIDDRKSRKDLLIVSGCPTKYTFGQ